MSTINLGHVAILPKGEYAAGTSYSLLDCVSYNGSSYLSKIDSNTYIPTNATYWQKMAQKGDTATVNGTNTLNITAGGDLTSSQSGDTFTISADIPEKTSDITNDSGFIDKAVNNLDNYTLASSTGSSLELSMNASTFVLTMNLKNAAGSVISTGHVDLPLETMVVNGSYNNTSKKIILELQSGSTVEIPVGDLISGLQSEITSSNKLNADLVDDSSSTNKFTNTTEKNKLAGIAANAQVNVIETVKVNNSALTPDNNKAVNITVPTKNSDLTNDNNTVTDSSYVHTDNNYTTTEKNKLAGIEANANNYSLPTASDSVLGGVKVGDSLSISEGILNVNNSDNIEKTIRNYYALTPDDKVYTVKFPLWETSNSCAGEKLDDNAGLSVTPATDTVREVSSYGPAWDSIDCNAYVDSNGVRHITALKGDENFKDTGKVDVFCLFRTYWQKIWTEDGYLYISRSFVKRDGYTINPLAINKDGTYNPWFLIPKYVAGDIDGKLYGSKGLIPAHLLYIGSQYNPSEEEFSDDVSYSGMVTKGHARGTYYSAGLMSEYMHILTTFYLKFATRDTQSIMKGNTDNNYQYAVSSAETDVNRVILTTAQAANIDLYSCVSVGDRGSATNNDRIYAYMHNIAYDVRVIGKEVIDEGHTALILDHPKFNTTATTYVSTMHERSGFSDYIKGRTGSIGNNTNGKHGFVLDGIEIAVGGYEVAGNAFMDIVDSNGKREIYFTNDSSKLTTSVATAKTTYEKSDLSINAASNASAGWKYITEFGFDVENGLAVPTQCGQSGSGTSVGYADGCYFDTSTSGQREFLWLGALSNGALAGLSCLFTNHGLSHSRWHVLARLSINGVGGELTE